MSNKDATLRATFTAVDKVSKPLSAMSKNIAGVRKAMSGVGAAGSKLGSALAPLAVAGAAAGAFAAKAVKGFLDTSGSLQDMSDRLGVSAEKLQEWQYVAEKSGVSGEDMQGSMEKLNKAIFAAGSGKGDAAKLFKKLGISVRDANGKLKTSADIMPQLADAFKKNENPTIRTAMAMQLMGKSGGAMIGVLSQGSEAIKKQQEEAKKLGIILSDADVAAGDAFSDGPLTNFTKQIGFLSQIIGAKLVPVLAPLVEKMSAWISENQVSIIAHISTAVEMFGEALNSIKWDYVVTGMKIVFGAIALSKVIGLASGIAGLITSIGGLAAALAPVIIAFAPVIADVALLGAAAFLLYKNWDGVIGGLKALWEDFSGWITPKIEWIVNKISGVGKIFSGFGSLFGGADAPTGSGRGRGAASGLNAGNKQSLQGEMVMRFENAPPGFRAEPAKTNMPGLNVNNDVGYRSMALGLS